MTRAVLSAGTNLGDRAARLHEVVDALAGDLVRMYLRYAERRGWKAEIADATVDELAEDVGPMIDQLLKPDR